MDIAGEKFDVIVVGAGNAATCAALSAREGGARVLMLEIAPEEARGGNSCFTGGAAVALIGLASRRGTVIWRCAAVFAAAGVAGAFAGSSLSKWVDGQRLLAMFALPIIRKGPKRRHLEATVETCSSCQQLWVGWSSAWVR